MKSQEVVGRNINGEMFWLRRETALEKRLPEQFEATSQAGERESVFCSVKEGLKGSKAILLHIFRIVFYKKLFIAINHRLPDGLVLNTMSVIFCTSRVETKNIMCSLFLFIC